MSPLPPEGQARLPQPGVLPGTTLRRPGVAAGPEAPGTGAAPPAGRGEEAGGAYTVPEAGRAARSRSLLAPLGQAVSEERFLGTHCLWREHWNAYTTLCAVFFILGYI